MRGSPCCRSRTRGCPDRGSTRAAPAARRGAIRLCAHHMCCTWPQLFAGSNEAHLIIDPFTIVLPTIVVRVRALTVALAVDPGPLMQHARQLTSRLDHLRTPAHHRSSHLVNVIICILQPTPTVHLPILDGAGVHRSLVQQEPRRRRDGVGSRRFRDRLAYSVS